MDGTLKLAGFTQAVDGNLENMGAHNMALTFVDVTGERHFEWHVPEALGAFMLPLLSGKVHPGDDVDINIRRYIVPEHVDIDVEVTSNDQPEPPRMDAEAGTAAVPLAESFKAKLRQFLRDEMRVYINRSGDMRCTFNEDQPDDELTDVLMGAKREAELVLMNWVQAMEQSDGVVDRISRPFYRSDRTPSLIGVIRREIEKASGAYVRRA